MGASVTLWEATAPVKLPTSRGPPPADHGAGEDDGAARVVFHRRLRRGWRPGFPGSHLSYTSRALAQRQAGVKLHGVFLSCRGSPVSSPVTAISPSPLSRQCPDRSTFRAGRNLPDKEFRYLRTVIVTAAVYRGFGSRLAALPLTFRHWAGLSPYTSTLCALAGTGVFGKQSPGPGHCGRLTLPRGKPRSRYARRPFSRSYGANLPSSLTGVLSSTWVYSTSPPVSVCGTVARALARGFSRRYGLDAYGLGSPPRLTLPSQVIAPADLPARLPTGLEGLAPPAPSPPRPPIALSDGRGRAARES